MKNENTFDMPSMETSMGMHSLTREERRQRILRTEIAKNIDHVLFTEWDPIGIRWICEDDDDCIDEYLTYVPKIVCMAEAESSTSRISDFLFDIETDLFGDSGSRSQRRCDVIAVLLFRCGPNYSESPFKLSNNTETPERAYQTVLDLVTQTRLDAYDKKWVDVCSGYEQAIALCQTYLHERAELLGTCLSNLGHAWSQLGQLEKAQGYFEAALLQLIPQGDADDSLYLVCQDNLNANLKYRRSVDTALKEDLVCLRLPVERDGRVAGPGTLEIE